MTTRKQAGKHAGIMGWPVEHSLSPRLHGFWLKKYGIDGDYTLMPVAPADLRTALKELAAKGIRGRQSHGAA